MFIRLATGENFETKKRALASKQASKLITLAADVGNCQIGIFAFFEKNKFNLWPFFVSSFDTSTPNKAAFCSNNPFLCFII